MTRKINTSAKAEVKMNKRKDLSNEDKNEILDLLNKNTPREVLCEQFNVFNATISNIKIKFVIVTG